MNLFLLIGVILMFLSSVVTSFQVGTLKVDFWRLSWAFVVLSLLTEVVV